VRLRLDLLLPVLAIAIAACSGSAASTSAASATPGLTAAPSADASGTPGAVAGGEIQVYAAASLKSALAAAKAAYETANPGTTLTISSDSSAALETKIEQGAPADVFLSADTKSPQKLVDGGFASGAVTEFAGNLLTIIVPTANPAGIKAPVDLATPGVKIIAAAEGVPIQRYTATLLDNLAEQPGSPAEFAALVSANVVSKEDNVGAIVTKVGLGEGDAGVVYVTDAKTSDKVATVEIPIDANVRATYGGVVVKGSRNLDTAGAFLAWLAGPDGRAILSSFGFPPAS
jgi:molybdate transport system substrate-binding protein